MTNQSFKKTDFLSYGGPIAHTAPLYIFSSVGCVYSLSEIKFAFA